MATDIVLAGDRNTLWGLAVTVFSALEAASSGLNIYVLETGFKEKDKDNLRNSWNHKNCEKIEFLEIPSHSIQAFRSTKYLKSKSTYSRYFIANLPNTVSRCIYLDTDLLVFKDLSKLSNLNLEENIIAAVRDVSVRFQPVLPELRKRLGVENEANYFSGGFLVIDLDSWRNESIEEKLINVSIEKFDQLDSQDQDALNIVFENRTLHLDVSWNISQYEKPDPLQGNIVHLMGTIKPWHARYTPKFEDPYFKDKIYDTFFTLLDQTAYRGSRPLKLGGIGIAIEHIRSNWPTRDMVVGKIRRTIAKTQRAPS